ncbi:MAG: hypothetical protein NUW37_11740 [Planctomycetes bacterium]|nr:hypothetical protein [Planctomycetota bacterium]
MELGEILRHLLVHNEAFIRRQSEHYIDMITGPQHPFLTVITGAEAKVQSEIFGMELVNRVYFVRNAGNQVAANLGSIDFAVNIYNTPVVMVLGMTDCDCLKAILNKFLGVPSRGTKAYNKLKLLTGTTRSKWTDQMAKEFAPLEKCVEKSLKHLDKYQSAAMQLAYASQLNVDEQVKRLAKHFEVKVKRKQLVLIGALYDTNGAFTDDFGRIIITNINGQQKAGELHDYAHSLIEKISYASGGDALQEITHDLIEEKIRRL